MSKISIYIETINRTMGDYISLELMPAKGCRVFISWGDGKTQSFVGKSETFSQCPAWIKVSHLYPKRGRDITLSSLPTMIRQLGSMEAACTK